MKVPARMSLALVLLYRGMVYSQTFTPVSVTDPTSAPNATAFTSARDYVYYGFHDVILLNGSYYAFAESNSSETMIVQSEGADSVWEAIGKVGGTQRSDGPLQTRSGISNGAFCTGAYSFDFTLCGCAHGFCCA